MEHTKNTNLHILVRNKILELIEGMNLEETTRLPTEKQLADAFEVSRVTIRAVLGELAEEGIIIRRHGRGTYINPVALNFKASLNPMPYYWNIIHNYGYRPSIELLEYSIIGARGQAGEQLRLNPSGLIACMKRIYKADDRMCIYCIDHFDYELIAETAFDPNREGSIFQLLYEAAGCSFRWASTQIIATDTARVPELKRYLDIPYYVHKPLMLFKKLFYDQKDYPVLYTESFFDTDIIEFNSIERFGPGQGQDVGEIERA